jgi:hypothetical protein
MTQYGVLTDHYLEENGVLLGFHHLEENRWLRQAFGFTLAESAPRSRRRGRPAPPIPFPVSALPHSSLITKKNYLNLKNPGRVSCPTQPRVRYSARLPPSFTPSLTPRLPLLSTRPDFLSSSSSDGPHMTRSLKNPQPILFHLWDSAELCI